MALPTASDNPFPSILAVETAAASIGAPAAGKQRLFVDTDHVLKYKNSGGAVSNVGGGGSSLLAKLYDYEVAGADKASIDTFVDGTTVTDFSGYSVLDGWALLRSDDAAAVANFTMLLNNDASSIYDLELIFGNNAAPGSASVLAAANWNISGLHGSGGSATYASVVRFTIPFPNSTTFWKTMELSAGIIDATAGNNWDVDYKLGYRSTSAITRLAIAPATALKKFKVGSRIVIYGR